MHKKFYLYTLIFFLFDFLTKILVINSELLHSSKPIISNFFSLVYTENTGAAFSIFKGGSVILGLVSILIIFILFTYYIKQKNHNKLNTLSFSLLIGGILGNCFDRIFYGYVIDFLSFTIFKYNFPIFNFADIFICIGGLLLIIDSARSEENESNSKRK